MKTVLLPPESLSPYPFNAKVHTPEQVEKIAAQIKAFGFDQPIVVDKDKVIVKGHGRREAAILLGLKHVPVVIADHLSENEVKAARIADNRVAEAPWDLEHLKVDLSALQLANFEMPLTGFDVGTLSIPELVLFQANPDTPRAPQAPVVAMGTPEGKTDADDVPEVPKDPVARPGDTWRLGMHVLTCGDSTDVEAVKRLMDGKRSHLTCTDPPYNVNYGVDNKNNPAGWSKSNREIMNDSMTPEAFREFCKGWIASIDAVNNGCIYVWGPPGPDGRIMFGELDSAFHCSTTGVWVKNSLVMGRGKYHNRYEPCWFGWNTSGARFVDDRTLTNVWEFDRPRKSDLHPTMKPIELIEKILKDASRMGDMVLDLFGGSGTTLIACERTGRACRMMELDPRYCDVIVNRWEAFTGEKAVLVTSG